MKRRIVMLLLCVWLAPYTSLAQCIGPNINVDSANTNGIFRDSVGWWIAQRGKTGGTRWVDIIKKRIGTLTNMAFPSTNISGWSQTTTRPGGFGDVRFDPTGTADEVTMGSTTMPSTTGKAMCAWAYPIGFVNFAAIYYHDSVLGVRYNSAGFYSDRAYDSAGGQSSQLTLSSGALPLNTWSHVCAVHYYSTTIRVAYYLNGLLDKDTDMVITDAGGKIGFAGPAAERIGNDPGAAGRNWNGRIDDVMVWQRGLNAGEIRTIYNDSRVYHRQLLCDNPLSRMVPGSLIAPGTRRIYAY